MTCCGHLIEITTQDDPVPVWICQECGKQGPPSMFPDPVIGPPSYTRMDRVRLRIVGWIEALADWVMPQ